MSCRKTGLPCAGAMVKLNSSITSKPKFSRIGTRCDRETDATSRIELQGSEVRVVHMRDEPHGAGAFLAQALDDGDVVERRRGPVGGAIGWAEGIEIALERRDADMVRRHADRRAAQFVDPVAHDRRDAGLERRARHIRCLAAVAPDDEMRAGERPVRIGRIGRREASGVDVGEKGADLLANGGIVAVLRDEDEDRDEAIEAVEPRQRPNPRAVPRASGSRRRSDRACRRRSGTARRADRSRARSSMHAPHSSTGRARRAPARPRPCAADKARPRPGCHRHSR